MINEAHSASYGIIIKVRKQPQRGDTTNHPTVIVSPRWGFEIISNLRSHSLRSGLVMYRPSGANVYLWPIVFVSFHAMISFLSIPQTLAICKGCPEPIPVRDQRQKRE